MRRLIMTCPCGQRMQVPRAAFGKVGVCSRCGQKLRVGSANAERTALPGPDGSGESGGWETPFAGRSESAKRRFGEAVDLFYQARYAEALAILDTLAEEFPGNEEVRRARRRCLDEMGARETARGEGAAPSGPETEGHFDEDTARRVILELMLRGQSDSVRLQAAELACRLLGLLGPSTERDDGKREAPLGALFAQIKASGGNGKLKESAPTQDAAFNADA